MDIPDFKNYYSVAHISRIIDWHCHRKLKDWIQVEDELSPILLQFSPWIPWPSYPTPLKVHPLIGTTLGIFHRLTKQTDRPIYFTESVIALI